MIGRTLGLVAALAVCACENGGDMGGGSGGMAGSGGDDAGSSGGTDAGADGTDAMTRPNWHQDIAPLVAENCGSCHRPGGIAFSMADYESASPFAEIMALQTDLRVMPPWHAIETDECQPPHAFASDPRLDEDQIQMFADWADAGAPAGDPELAAPLPPPKNGDLADPNVTVKMGGSVTIQQEGSKLDFFHCLSFDPGNTEDVYIDGMQVIPGNSAVAHHVLIYMDTTGESASWSDGMIENCDGGTGLSDAQLVGAWVPGALPVQTPDDVGIYLPAGARLVYNMHFHADPTGPQVDDGTSLALHWSTDVPEWIAEASLVGTPGNAQLLTPPFEIPPDGSNHVETLEFTLPTSLPEVRVWAVGNHMHKVGVDMKTSIMRAGGGEECLVQTPDWDFDWQRLYQYDTPIEDAVLISPGDTVRVRCTYDNTLDNPGVVEALGEVGEDQPRDVVVGNGTLDEMCIGALVYAHRN